MHRFGFRHGKNRGQDSGLLLAAAKKGEIYRVVSIEGGREVTGRLASMGIFPGCSLDVVTVNPGGPLVIRVLDSRVMLSRGLANKILVRT